MRMACNAKCLIYYVNRKQLPAQTQPVRCTAIQEVDDGDTATIRKTQSINEMNMKLRCVLVVAASSPPACRLAGKCEQHPALCAFSRLHIVTEFYRYTCHSACLPRYTAWQRLHTFTRVIVPLLRAAGRGQQGVLEDGGLNSLGNGCRDGESDARSY